MIHGSPNQDTARALRFLRVGLEPRIAAARAVFLREVATRVTAELQDRIPEDTPEQRAYKNGLRVADVTGVAKGTAVAVIGTAPANMRTIDASRTLLFFSSTRGVPEPAGAILAVDEPWTVDQLPPVAVTSRVIFRVASDIEIEQNRERCAKARPMALQLLRHAQVPLTDHFVANGESLIDIENYALRMEFGLPGVPHIPHWRPVVAAAAAGKVTAELRKDGRFVDFLNRMIWDDTFTGWDAESLRAKEQIPVRELARFSRFMKAVGPT